MVHESAVFDDAVVGGRVGGEIDGQLDGEADSVGGSLAGRLHSSVDKTLGNKLACWLADDLVALFNQLFAETECTLLVAGGEEPVYLPIDDQHGHARIIFTRDYYASALHEVAHWCLAGEKRRQQVDYGYWYVPNRDQQQQHAFETVEAKPQALESLLADAAGYAFSPSMDNLALPEYQAQSFKVALHKEREAFQRNGLPARAELFYRALMSAYAAP